MSDEQAVPPPLPPPIPSSDAVVEKKRFPWGEVTASVLGDAVGNVLGDALGKAVGGIASLGDGL